MRISNQRTMIRISNEYSLGCVGVAVYGQRYGGTIKLTSPEAFGMPYLDSRFEQFERRTDYVDVYIHMPVLALFLGICSKYLFLFHSMRCKRVHRRKEW